MKNRRTLVFVFLLILISLMACTNNLEHSVEVFIKGQGKVVPLNRRYKSGTITNFLVIPAENWVFAHWEGINAREVVQKDGHWSLLVNSDKEITAVFKEARYNLQIIVVGNGRVDQLLSCSDDYPYGTFLELQAVADWGWQFGEWQGDLISKEPKVYIGIDGDKEITAIFEQKSFSLNISVVGEGEVREELFLKEASSDYQFGDEVLLEALAAPGWEFVEWQGDLEGNEAQTKITIDGHKNLRAIFASEISKESFIHGQIAISHSWPNPYGEEDNYLTSYARRAPSLPLLEYAHDRAHLLANCQFVKGELLVGFDESDLWTNEGAKILEELGLEIVREIKPLSTYLVKIPVSQEDLTLEKEIAALEQQLLLRNCSSFFIEPNYYYQAYAQEPSGFTLPDDELFARQWHYRQIRLPQAWDLVKGSSAIKIALLDTGVNYKHPDLTHNVLVDLGYNTVDNNEDVMDRLGHGTHCAGTIAANTNNYRGVAGVMWEASIIPVKVLDDEGSGSAESIAQGILYAAGLGENALAEAVHIINMSLGGNSSSKVIEKACEKASEKGVIIVAAAGNNASSIGYPAAYDSVICVGATDYNYPYAPRRASYSNFGMQMDLVAPGGDSHIDSDKDGFEDGILSTTFSPLKSTKFSYGFKSGSSMAAPHVTGVIGLMLANGLAPQDIRQILHHTAMDLGPKGFDLEYGYGLVNAYWAVNNVQEIQILVGKRDGQRIEALAKGRVDLKSQNYTLSNIPVGEYQVFAWIDVRNSRTIDKGDYFFESSTINFSGDGHQVHILLKELH